ncbi:MAG: MEKHLA domain-containing protein [Methylococcales bacterium]|nr:MEKHLA domain-containing protein [Methylococcales bacterium]
MFFPHEPSIQNQFLSHHTQLLNHSFQQFFQTSLLETQSSSFAEKLFYAPFVVLSHNTDDDPIFNYANQKGLELFELDWSELIKLPSRLSAEPIRQMAREILMAKVATDGYMQNYEGIRVSSVGKRFQIKQATIWNLSDDNGAPYGQAACFSDWTFL